MVSIEVLTDILVFIFGLIMIGVSLIFLQLYIRHRRRDYFILSLVFLIAAIQGAIGEFDILLPENVEVEFLDFISAFFSILIAILILVVLFFPHKVPLEFIEKKARELEE